MTTAAVLLALVLVVLVAGLVLVRRRNSTPPTAAGQRRQDPFALAEPWRHFATSAADARRRLEAVVTQARPGPLRDTLLAIDADLVTGEAQLWEVATFGQRVQRTRRALDVEPQRRRLAAIGDTQTEEATSLRAQVDVADRLAAQERLATDTLRTITARLSEAVSRAAELAVTGSEPAGLASVGVEVNDAVDRLTALRDALAETDGRSSGGTASAASG